MPNVSAETLETIKHSLPHMDFPLNCGHNCVIMYDKLYKTDLCSRRLDSCTLSCSSLLCSSASLLYVYTAAAADTPPPTAAVADLPLSSAANLDRALQCHYHYHGYN